MEIKKILIISGIAIALLGIGTYFSKNKVLGDSGLPNTFLSATNGSVAVLSSTSTSIMLLNGVRQFAEICNTGTSTQPVYLSFSVPAVVSKGITLSSGTCFEINNTKGYLGSINGISASGTSTVTTIEK